MVLGGRLRSVPAATDFPAASKEMVDLPSLSMGSTLEVVKECSATLRSNLYTIGSGDLISASFDHFWCFWLPSEFCWPTPGPGGCAQLLKVPEETGLAAFGTGSG